MQVRDPFSPSSHEVSRHRARDLSWRSVAPSLVLLGIAASTFGCDDVNVRYSPCGNRPCPSDCTALELGSCDVLEASCRERILDAVICVRGTPGVMPAVRILTEDEYRQELLEAQGLASEDDAGVDDDAGSDDDAGRDAASDARGAGTDVEPDHWSEALVLLGLLAPMTDNTTASIDEAAQFVAGFYDSNTQRMTLIDRGQPLDNDGAVTLLAHELVHALQDQEVGLREFGERGPGAVDGWHSRNCLIEGEAVLYEELSFALLQGLSLGPDHFERYTRSRLKYARRSVVESVSPYTAVWRLRYPVGLGYLHDAWADHGNWAVQSLYDAPPISSIHWMVGYEEDIARREHLVLPLFCDLAAAPKGYERVLTNSLGPLVLYAFLGHALRDDGIVEGEAQWNHALHWRQDQFAIFAGRNQETAVSYRVRFDDDALVHELAVALEDAPLDVVVHEHGDELEILGAQDSSAFDAWETDPAACPEPE